MKILWMKPILPFPPNQGTRRVTLQLLRNLSGEHRIRLFARLLERHEGAQVDALRREVPGLEVVAPLTPNRRSGSHRIYHRVRTRWGATRGIPPVEGYTAPPSLLRDFAREVHSFQPDLVVAEYWYASAYLHLAGSLPGALFAHDIEYQVRERAGARRRDGGRGGTWGRLEVMREKTALAAAPFTWFLTAGDRDEAVHTLGLAEARTAIMPYGVDLDGTLGPRRPEDPPEDPSRVLLFGSFAADFNRDALEFTLEEVWPALRRLTPRAGLAVAGGGLEGALANRARALGARVLGEVSDVRAALLSAAVVLVPLRYGGGLRIRLLESLALERAVVGTPVGVLGMGPRAEHEVLTGETAEELAGQVARALGDAGLRRSLGRAGREWVQAHHGMETAAAAQRRAVVETLRAQRLPRV